MLVRGCKHYENINIHDIVVFFFAQSICRNPVAANRPGFRDIFLSLLGNPEEMLSIPPEALDSHHLAGVLGSPLEAGENMYPDLHNQYFSDHDLFNI